MANERKNLNNLTKTLATIDEFEKGGRIDYLQVANVEQDKLSSESNVERLKQDLKTSLDRFKLQLGLPADFPLDLDDTPIRPIENHLEKFERTIAEAQDVRVQLQELYNEKTREEFLTNPEKLRTILFDVLAKHPLIRGTKFQKTLAEKRQKWRNIPEAERKQALEIAAEKYGILNKKLQNLRDEAFLKKIPLPEKKIADLNRRLDELKSTFNWAVFEGVLREFEAKKWVKLKNKTEKFGLLGRQFIAVLDNLAPLIIEPREERLTELSTSWPKLPPITVGGINLLSTPEDIAQEIVKQSALTNRLDLMNARAQVVDAWRQIAVFANSLLGVFNVRYRFNTTTPFGEAKPFNFDPSRNTHQLFLNAELPLVRKAERNNYRASLIAFERARRGLMASEDTIVFTVRNEIRELLRLAEVYRIQRRAVELAYPQVESSNEELFGPVNPDVLNRPSSSGENAALTQQLLRNQAALVRAQNNVYDVWVDYLITRLRLLRDIEQLPLDFPGVGIDDTSTTEIPDRSRPERLPPPNPIPADPVQNANPL